MKHLFLVPLFVTGLLFFSCDKVSNSLEKEGSSGIDWSLYPNGDSTHYAENEWPSFPDNTNTLRNVLIEDFTGHRCVNCPAQTANMEQLIETNPARIFGVAIHAGNTGLTYYQEVETDLPDVLFCNQGLELGDFFGSIPGANFYGNPAFCVNRVKANDQFTSNAGSPIANKANNCLASSLKVNVQAASNYFPGTRGLFLHTEVDKLDQSLTNDLGLVVYVIEDSLIGPQTVEVSVAYPNGRNDAYVHREIMRGCIDGKAFGRVLSSADLNANGKYYVNYSYKVPDELEVENIHLVIYVYDKTTLEIYQVIKHDIK